MSELNIDVLQVTTLVVLVLLAIAWYLSYSAARLDRLHAKVEGAMSVLDAQLVRRAEASLELANTGGLDPASAFLLADAATESLERKTEHAGDDLLEEHNFAGREDVETDLTLALRVALPHDVVGELRADPDSGAASALSRVESAAVRVQLARRFHNQAVAEVRRVRAKRVVRWFRLAGHAGLPAPVDFDDEPPEGLAP